MNSRDKLRETMTSLNPLRNNIALRDEDLFILEYMRDRGINAGIVRNYNRTIEHIREFVEKRQMLNERSSRVTTTVIIAVKITIEGTTHYYTHDQVHMVPHPFNFIKNKGMNISLTIATKTDLDQLKEVIPLPFMVGCKWCPTSIDNHDPIRNHQHGENAVDLRGYVLLNSDKGGCTPKYFFAHEKIAHNNISTVENDKGVFMTTLKTQDSKNNSVETRLYKKKVDGQADVYYIETTCFKEPLRVNDLFSDICDTLNKLAAESEYSRECHLDMIEYDTFIEEIMLSVAGEKLINYIIYDFTPNETSAFDLTAESANDSKKMTLESRTKELFRETNNRVQYYTENFKDFYNTDKFTEFMINAIFPSIAPLKMNSLRSRYNTYIGKAILLMRILIWNILTESQILEPTDRNDIGRKVYMAIDQVIRRDITRDNGAILDQKTDNSSTKIHYNPKTASSKGETNVIETFDMANLFNSIAQLTSVNTPRGVLTDVS